jgi:sortase A
MALVVVSLCAACADTDATAQLAPIPTTTVEPTTTLRPTSTSASTTSTTSTTSSTSTTSTSTTTVPQQLTQPIAPPSDPRGPEDNPPIGFISIPALGLDTELEEGIRLTTLDRGPGHWPGSAMPGEVGNVVIAGHRTSRGAEFRHVDQLVPGDEMVLTSDAGSFTYHVTGIEIVGPEALWITTPTDTPTATLFACHPPGSTAKRIVVHLSLAT